MSGQDLLRRDKALTEWWAGVVRDPKFDQVTAMCRADLFSSAISYECVVGANKMVELLETIAGVGLDAPPYPSPGIIHEPVKKASQ